MSVCIRKILAGAMSDSYALRMNEGSDERTDTRKMEGHAPLHL
jgi:hypothetical protein